MKRLLTVLLCIVLSICLLACNNDGNNETTAPDEAATLLVGFGREDITPQSSVPLAGYWGGVYSASVMDPLYATCIAFTDAEDNTILLYHMDLCTTGGSAIPFARKAISEATGIPVGNVMVAATHTHSAPQITSSDPSIEDYTVFMEQKMIAAAKAALADRKPSEMYTARTELTGLNFVRHYIMDDNSVVGDNFGNPTGKKYVKHVRDADSQMQLIRFKREGGKDVVLVNWQVHPLYTSDSKTTHLSADVVGAMRMALEPQMDCYMAYFTGGAADLSPKSRITSENLTSDYLQYGAIMAREAALACDSMTRQNSGKVQILNKKLEATAKGNPVSINAYAFSIGDIAFVTAPYEMFDDNAKYIKENSPFEMTIVASYANGHGQYIASEWAYAYPSYESTNGNYDKGVAEKLAEDYVTLLNEIYPSRGSVETGKTEAEVTAALYFNLDQGKKLTADANGVYTVRFVKDGQQVSLKITDKAMADSILQRDFVGLELDGDTVTKIISIADMPFVRMATDYYVKSIGGKNVKLSSNGVIPKELMLKLTDGLPVYDAVLKSSTFGSVTQLQKNDVVSVIADSNGNPVLIYVTARPAVAHEGLLYCQHCQKEVSWFDWTSDSTLPIDSGHYLLTSDVTLTDETKLSKGNICLDLNGKTVKQTTFGTRIYSLLGEVTLSIMDSAEGGTFIPVSTDSKQNTDWGMVIFVNHDNAVLNLHSGTLDASNCTARYGCAISQKYGTFNMYGGTILGGTTYGQGSCAVSANGYFNMYGGRIVGGKVEKTDFVPESPAGGGAIRVLGTTTIYGGIIEGGNSYNGGGVLRVCMGSTGTLPKLILKGGTITGGKAPNGSGIYVTAGSVVTISGDVKITGNQGDNLYLEKGVTISIGEEGLGKNAQIGITMAEAGTFVSNAPAGTDLSKYFISDDSSKKIVSTGNGSWAVK